MPLETQVGPLGDRATCPYNPLFSDLFLPNYLLLILQVFASSSREPSLTVQSWLWCPSWVLPKHFTLYLPSLHFCQSVSNRLFTFFMFLKTV